MTSARSLSCVGALLSALMCRSAIADPSATCPEGWFCEPPPADAPPRPASPRPASPPGGSSRPEAAQEPAAADDTLPPNLVWPEMDTYEPEPASSDRSWGVQVRFDLPLIDDGDSPAHPLMAGAGLGFVYLPLDHIGLELAVDSAFGRDALDARRRELGVSGALLAFFDTHPRLRAFLSMGLFHSWAEVEPPASYERHYRYFGALLGLGAELTLRPLTSAFVRFDGFMRGRVDAGAGSEPEFVHSATGETSNSSAGALLRIGAARYF